MAAISTKKFSRKWHQWFIFKSVGITLMLLLLANSSQSQVASAKMIPDTILIGQPSTMFIEVDAIKGDLVILPNLTGSIYEHIEFSGVQVDTIPLEDNRISIKFRLPFTSWTPAYFTFDPLPIAVLRDTDTLRIESNPFTLQVLTIDIDEGAEIYDIKPIKKMRASLREILTYFIPLVLLLALIGWLVYRYFFKKKKPVALSIWEDEEIPAHIAAISSLEKLRSQKLWQLGKIKQYHSELTFIVRMFIEKRFKVPALEMTTNEICKTLLPHLHNKNSINELKGTLEVADLVKFAKYQPLPNENDKSLEQAIEFVKANVEPEEIKEEKGKTPKKDSLEPNQ